MKLFTFGIIFSSFLSAYAQPQKMNTQKLDDFIIRAMRKDSIPGMVAAIFVNKQPVWLKGYGYANRETKTPFTPHTIMNIASISKTFTGVCMMKAVEERVVSLDEDINTYIPFRVVNSNLPKAKITLRHLATHTSGIIDQEAYISSYHFGGDPSESLGGWLESYFTPRGKYYKTGNFSPSLPGERYEYSNIGAALAGYVIECATKQTLSKYCKEKIFIPLKMNDSGWSLSEIDTANHARLYYREDNSIIVVEPYGLVTYPDGGVRTSVSDLSVYFTCLLNGGTVNGITILTNESVTLMTTPQFNSKNKPRNINLKNENSGLFWSLENNNTKTGHDGGDPGVDTEMFYDQVKDVGIILFVNISSDDDRKSQAIKGIPGISKKLWQYAELFKGK